MPNSENAAVVGKLIVEVWGKGDLSLLPEIVADAVTAHVAAAGAPLQGLQSYREFIATYHGIYGQVRFRIDDQLVDGEKVATRWTAHLEEGRSVIPDLQVGARDVMGMNFSRLVDGKVVKSWDTWDALSALQGSEGMDLFERLSISI